MNTSRQRQKPPRVPTMFRFPLKNRVNLATFGITAMALGLVVEPFQPVSTLFLTVYHAQSISASDQSVGKMYVNGLDDVLNVFAWFLAYIIVHAFIRDNVFNKIHEKWRLSEYEKLKFNLYGLLIIFNSASIIWTSVIIIVEYRFANNLTLLLTGLPHNAMPLSVKLLYISQLAYWAHMIPEIFVQKLDKYEIFNQAKYSGLNFAFILISYISHFNCAGILVLWVHHIFEFIKHTIKLKHITKKNEDSKKKRYARRVRVLFILFSQSSIFILSHILKFYYHLTGPEFRGDFNDFKTHLIFDALPLGSLLRIQSDIIIEFPSDRKSRANCIKYDLPFFHRSIFRAETNKASSNKKRKNADCKKN